MITPGRNSEWPQKTSKGFTLVEMLVSVGILSIIFVVGFTAMNGVLSSFYSRQGQAQIMQSFGNASLFSRVGREGAHWGVRLDYDESTRVASGVTVFSGMSYAMRDTSFDQEIDLDPSILITSANLSGASPSSGNDHEVIFQPLDAATEHYGTVVVSVRGTTSTISISPYGNTTLE